ncbi:MAG: FIST C-terminal domain-containing protein [Terrimicrobiaceae bacterium]|nr:FIST C-terminal domain-containing protein [Terrimicrobiaceae bacterium]
MIIHRAESAELEGAFSPEATAAAARRIREGMGRPSRVAFVFVDTGYREHLAEFCEILRVDGHIRDVVGCTAGGQIIGPHEKESAKGCSILALSAEAGEPIVAGDEHPVPDKPAGLNAWVTLLNPFAVAADDWLSEWNAAFPGVPTLGGLASGGDEEDVAVFLNGEIVDGVAVPFTGSTTVIPVISQGCRPIGEPLTVTKAEHNVVYALGGQPAYTALESAFQSLTDDEKSNARGNLFAGIAGTEYVEEFKPGDFLIRNIIGADPNSGAVVIGGIPRIGQTLQYQLRDRKAAESDLHRGLEAITLSGRIPVGSLLFSCLARGEKFFGTADYDAARVFQATLGRPVAGFFCNGEIGPVAGRNALHSYTAAAAIWVEKPN